MTGPVHLLVMDRHTDTLRWTSATGNMWTVSYKQRRTMAFMSYCYRGGEPMPTECAGATPEQVRQIVREELAKLKLVFGG